MFQSEDLDKHLKTSDTIEIESKVYAEWNFNDPDNIKKLGNYRYRPADKYSPYFDITNIYDPYDLQYWYTGATDSDVVVGSGLNDENEPTVFIDQKNKMKLLYSLEDCIKPFRPRSGINKLLYFENDGTVPASAQYIDDSRSDIARRPRYYMSSRDDQFKYWTSYRTEYGMVYPLNITSYSITEIEAIDGTGIITISLPHIIKVDDNILVSGTNSILDGTYKVISVISDKVYFQITSLSPIISTPVSGTVVIVSPKNQVTRGFSFYVPVQDNPTEGINYIDDSCPFVVYDTPVPTNKIVIKMQTNVGEEDHGTFKNSKGSFPDPFYGNANKTTPIQWKIQALKQDSWEDLVSFNDIDNSLIGADGYVEISYGFLIPDQYKDIFIFAEEISSLSLLPDTAVEGYTYLVRSNKDDLGVMYIYTNMQWKSFVPTYNWHISSQELDKNTNAIKKLVNPDYYKDSNQKTIYKEFDFIEGIRIVVKTMNKANCAFDLIEFSPRLFADITESVSDYSVSKIMSDMGNGSIPVGGIFATTGSLTIYDNDFSFNENNPFDPRTGEGSIVAGYLSKVVIVDEDNPKKSSKNYLDNMVKFIFYENIKNVPTETITNGVATSSLYDYYIPVKSMYAYGFPQTISPGSLIQLDLRDFFFFLESSPAPQLFLTDVSISYLVTLLLDYIGFDNYVFKRIKNYPEIIIPYFFVEPGQNCAEVLLQLAVASQTAMFFDEYNNFVVMSKEYILPNSEINRDTDKTLYGQVQAVKSDGTEVTILGYLMSEDELPMTNNLSGTGYIIGNSTGETVFEWVSSKNASQWVNQGYPESINAPNIINIASKERRVYNAGQVNYTSRYLQRSIGSVAAATKTDRYKEYIYKPSLLWEVQGQESRQTQNELGSQNQGYVLGAVPLNSDLTSELPYAKNGQIYNNIIDVGENSYWMTNYQGYLYSAGEIIKFDAMEYSVNIPVWYPISSSGNIDYQSPIIVPSGLLAPIGTEDIPKWRSEHVLGSSNVWITSNHQYQDFFGNLPFNGKMYPTGRIRIYTEPEYESVDNLIRVKDANPIAKHGRGQFGTTVTNHSAGLDSYWTDNNNVSGFFQNSGPYLFNTNQYINYPADLTKDASGEYKRVVEQNQNTPDKITIVSGKELAQRSLRTGVIKTFLADKTITEKDLDYLKTTSPGSVQSSALCFSGPGISDQIPKANFVSYIIKDFKDENNAAIPFKHYGTRMRIIGKIESGTNNSQTPIDAFPIFTGDATNIDTVSITNPSTTSTTPNKDPIISGGSGGLAFNVNSSANTGYFFEIVALTVDNVKDYQSGDNNNIVSANILASPAPTCTNNEVTVYTKDPISWEVGQKVVISGLVDTNDPNNTQTPLNGEYAITGIFENRKRFKYKINPPSPLTTTSKTGGVATIDVGGDINIANMFFYKTLSSNKGNGVKSYSRQNSILTLTLNNVNTFAAGEYVKIKNVSASVNGEYTINKIVNQSLIMNPSASNTSASVNISTVTRTVAASVTDEITLTYPMTVPYKLWSGLTEIITDTGEFYGQGRLMGEEKPTVYDLSAEYIPIGTSRRFYLYLNGKQVGSVDDPDPLPERNNMAIFVRGTSKCMFENVYALGNNYSQNANFSVQTGISKVFGDSEIDATEAFNKYSLSGLVQKTFLTNVSSLEDPKYKIYFEEFGSIMREAAYFNIKYDRAYPALSAKLMPTFNNLKGYTTSGFYAWSYGAEFLIFNATDFALTLDDTSGNYLRIMGIAFTQSTTYTLTVDELFKKRSNLIDTAVGKDVTLYNPLRVNEEYNKLQNSRIKYGKNEFTLESKYLQTTDAAENVFSWIVDKISKPKKLIGINTFGTSNVQLGDIVKINYISNEGIDVVSDPNKRFVIYQIDYAKGANGYNNTMYLAEV